MIKNNWDMKRVGLIIVCLVVLGELFTPAAWSARKDRDQEQLDKAAELVAQNRVDEAIAAYSGFIKQNPKSDLLGKAYLGMGKLYLQKKDNDQALKALNEAIQLGKTQEDKQEASLLSGKIFYNQKRYLEAVENLHGVYDNVKNPKSKTEVAGLLYQSCRQLSNNQQAVYWLGRYTETAEPKDIDKAKALALDLAPKLSESDLEQDLKAEGPDWLKGELFYQLAKKQMDAGKTDDAKNSLETLLKKYRDSARRDAAGELLGMIDKSTKVETGRLGVILPLSGPLANFGERALKGALLAAGIFKPVEGQPKIELRVVNADSDAQAATDAVKKMVADDNILGLVGPVTNTNSLAVADLAVEMGLPMIALSPAPGLTAKGPTVFRDCMTKQSQVKALLDWSMKEEKRTRFAVIYSEEKYGTEFADLFEKEVMARGGKVTHKIPYSSGETDFRDQVAQLTARDFDAIFIPDSWEKVDLIVPQLLYFRIKAQILGTSGWHSPKLFDQIKASYLEGAVFVDLFAPEAKAKEFEDFSFAYSQAYGENPTLVDTQAYEAVSLLMNIMSKNKINSRKALADALASGSWAGPLGNITVSPDREITHQLTLFRITKGEFVPLK